jgi:hypothetical protein
VPPDDPRYLAYHDDEWGVPVHDDVHLFEMLTLEGAQAGLSWATILKKRDGYRTAFAGFAPVTVARFTPAKVERLLQDPGIVRNRLKVESTVANAKATLAVHRGPMDAPPGDPGRDAGVARDVEGSEAPRVPVRGADRVLRVHAGGRVRERPRDRLLPLPTGLRHQATSRPSLISTVRSA